MKTKNLEELTVDDIVAAPVWKFTRRDEPRGETVVQAIKKLPVENLDDKIVGTTVVLANGKRVWAILGNVVSYSPRATQHFLTLSVERDGAWFAMARYYDSRVGRLGPKALCKFLGLTIDEVFPIFYDISQVSKGHRDALIGTIEKEPKERLTEDEIIALALE